MDFICDDPSNCQLRWMAFPSSVIIFTMYYMNYVKIKGKQCKVSNNQAKGTQTITKAKQTKRRERRQTEAEGADMRGEGRAQGTLVKSSPSVK